MSEPATILSELERQDIRAQYKIEIMFGPNRTAQGSNIVCVQIYESGKFFHGGGDDKSYWCKDVRAGRVDGCDGIITSQHIKGGLAICPNCQMALNTDFLTGERFIKRSTKDIAEYVAKLFRQLDHSCDIYCKYNAEDIRYKICVEKVGSEKARWLKGLFIYPLGRIIKDTAAGSSLEARIRAFLSA
jgi:hypothetical protein